MGSVKTFELPGSMDISKVSDFHTTLRDTIAQGDEVIFVAAGVERADTAFIQLLAAFTVDAPSKNISIKWQEPSDALCAAVKQLGLQDCLQVM